MNDQVKIGDVFFFTLADFYSIQIDSKKLAAIKEMYHRKGVFLAMEGGYEGVFEMVCDELGSYNPYKGQVDKPHLPDEIPLWIFAGSLPSAASYTVKLVPSESQGLNAGEKDIVTANPWETIQYMDDCSKEKVCDLIVTRLKKCLIKPLPKACKDGVSAEELTRIISAHRITIPGTQCLKWSPWGNNYGGTNRYQMEILVWNAYSEEEKRNFYLIHQELIMSFSDAFAGEYHGSPLYKDYGFCGTQIECWFKYGSECNDVRLHETSPATTQQVTTYTSGLSYNLGGKVGVSLSEKPGASADLSGGVTMTSGKSYSAQDINISNLCQPSDNPSAKWQFHIREPNYHFSIVSYGNVAVDAGGQMGIETFTGGTDSIFSIPQGAPSEWRSGYEVTVVLYSWYDVMNAHTSKPTIKTKKFELSFTLPVVK